MRNVCERIIYKDIEDALVDATGDMLDSQKFCRTSNLIERTFEEERRMTKVIPGFIDKRNLD